MFKKGMRVLFAAAAALPLIASTAWAEGLMTIIVNDPSNPYWFTEGEVAKKTAEGLGYKAVVGGHKGDTNTESNLIDTAITNKSVAIILDPANADGSVGAVKRAIAANIPVFLINAEINQEGFAKAQLVSNNAQGAALGATQWVESVGDKGKYVELFGAPSDNNAATRSNGYETVLSQYPDLVRVGKDVANWDRTQGHDKMQALLQANPDIIGVISGNDEMALGAIAALKKAGKLDQVKVGGFDGSPDAIAAIRPVNCNIPFCNRLPCSRKLPSSRPTTSSRPARPAWTMKSSFSTASSSPRTMLTSTTRRSFWNSKV